MGADFTAWIRCCFGVTQCGSTHSASTGLEGSYNRNKEIQSETWKLINRSALINR